MSSPFCKAAGRENTAETENSNGTGTDREAATLCWRQGRPMKRITMNRRFRANPSAGEHWTGLIIAALVGMSITGGAQLADEPVKITFENVTEALGLEGLQGDEACWIDYNNDGWTDLQDGGSIWRNEDGKTFVRVDGGGSQNSWADLDNDGYLDFWNPASGTINFGSRDGSFTQPEKNPERLCEVSDGGTCTDVNGDGLVDIYWTGFENNGFQPDAIWLNQGDRIFKRIWKTEGPAQGGRGTMTCDFDNDGDMDIYVSNYYAQANVLWINDGTGNFTDGASEYGVDGGNGYTVGSAFGDINNDGYIDLLVGNFARPGMPQSQFFRNLGPDKKFHFENMGTCGVDHQQSFSPALGDYDNDGDLDLFFAAISYGGLGESALFRNEGNWSFKKVTGEVGLGGIEGAQAAWGDFDNDGDLDLASGGRLWRNSGNKNKWLKVRPVGTADYNRSAIGAQVRIKLGDKILTRQVESSTGRGNLNDFVPHFGLGAYEGEKVEITVTWPNGREKKETVEVNKRVTVEMPAPQAGEGTDSGPKE